MPKFKVGDIVKIVGKKDTEVCYRYFSREMWKYVGKYAIVTYASRDWRGNYVYIVSADRGCYYWDESWLEETFTKNDFILEE
jgi:hypothetical protein